MTPNETLLDIRSCVSDWDGLVANQRAIRSGRLVCWANYRSTIDNEVTWSTVTSLATNLQYSFQLFDGSLIQLLYDFSLPGDDLRSTRLAYYEGRLYEEPDDDKFEDTILPLEETREERLPRWVRLDYGRHGNPSCIHSECHLHFGGLPETRISCNAVPGPRQFLEGVFAWFYPELYRERILARDLSDRARRYVDVNRHSHTLTPSDHFHSLVHLSLPGSIRDMPS
jgi:hypothetical protein